MNTWPADWSPRQGDPRPHGEDLSTRGMVVNHWMGAYHGRFGFETLSHPKTVLTEPTRPDAGALNPP